MCRCARPCPGNIGISRSAKEAVFIEAQNNGKRNAPAQGAGNGAPKRKRRKKRRFSIIRFLLNLIGCLLCLVVMLGAAGTVVLAMYVVQVTADDEEILDLDSIELEQASQVFDANGELYTTFTGNDNRLWVDLASIPEDLQHAVIAVEDKDFYQEWLGINIKRTLAAVLNELADNRLLGSRQGASTLEQQLIKNLTGDNAKDKMRKVREIFRAIGLSRRYSKETVLEAYLNTISLTGTIYGMEVGANEYFGKSVGELTLAECATLASISKAPTTYHPYYNPENLVNRRNHVLSLMREQGYITAAECEAAKAEPLTLVESAATAENVTRTSRNSWFADALFESLVETIMTDRGYTRTQAQAEVYSGGLSIYSTVDPKVQSAIEEMWLNEDDETFPALWRNDEVGSKIPADGEIILGDDGLPRNPDGSRVFGTDDIPVYKDDEGTVFRTAKADNGTLVFYRRVRTQAAIAILDYDGHVLGLAGGLGEKTYDRGLNRATVPHQTGSTMKPIAAYCLALDSRLIHYSTRLRDEALYTEASKTMLKAGVNMDPNSAAAQARDDIWRSWPKNVNNQGGAGNSMLVYDALRRSYNTIAVYVGNLVGLQTMFDFAHDTLNCTYLDAENDMGLSSLVLGGQYRGLSVVQLAGAFSIFYDGSYTTPHYFTEVYDSDGNLYLDNSKYITTTQAIRPDTATIMNRMLQNVLKPGGTANGMAPNLESGIPAAAKTGTTTDKKDLNFAALTPYYVSAVWWGYDNPERISDSGKPNQKAWKALMEQLLADAEYKDFPMADNVVRRTFDPNTGRVGDGGAWGYYTEDNMESNYAPPSAVDPLTGLPIS